MTDHNPISPLNLVPEELLDKWVEDWPHFKVKHIELVPYIAAMAAQWGADQELEAIQKEIIMQAWFVDPRHRLAQLRAARRPKPPSVKQQALTDLGNAYNADQIDDTTYENILRALEALPE